MADVNVKANVQRTSTIGKVRILVEQVVGSPSQAQISQAVADYIDSHPGALSPLSQATKSALLDIAEHVAYIDANGQSRYDALDAALNAKALLSITAVYTQSGTVYDTDSLDSLKADLVVTAYYDDGTSADVTSASVLSGTLTEGTSTITVTFSGKTATFEVTVSAPLYAFVNGTHTFTTPAHKVTVEDGNVVTIEHINVAKAIQANISNVFGNGATADTSTNYASSTAIFTIPSGASVKCVFTPLIVEYSTSAMGGRPLNFTFQGVNGAAVPTGFAFMHNQNMSTLTVGTPIIEEYTLDTDVPIGCIGTWMSSSSTATAKVKGSLELYVNGVRWI